MSDQKIRLNPEFSLCYDSQGNHWLIKNKINDKGKVYTETYCGYHYSFASLLQSFLKVQLPEKEAKTVKSALTNLAEIQEEIKGFIGEFGQLLDDQKKEVRMTEKDMKELEKYRKEKLNAGK